MYNIHGCYDRGKIDCNLSCYFPCSGQFVYLVGGEGDWVWEMGKVIVLARYKFDFIIVHNNLV